MSSSNDRQESLPPEPTAEEVIGNLEERLGEDRVRSLIGECLKSVPRLRAVELMNLHLPTVKLGTSADRGRMGRLLADGVQRRREAVLEAVQAIARDPFELKAGPEAKERLDEAIESLNRARAGQAGAGSPQEAARQVAGIVNEILDPDEARRLILLNAFPDVLDDMLAVVEGED